MGSSSPKYFSLKLEEEEKVEANVKVKSPFLKHLWAFIARYDSFSSMEPLGSPN